MTTGVLLILGGVGLFLLGMQTMTDALKQLANRTARQVLARATSTPILGTLTGLLTTVAVQSSSAITLIVVGFVGAGLISFAQAVGVILGANIGSTFTGWIVLLVGFKLKLGMAALPLVLAGSLLRLLARGDIARLGSVLAGFSLLFIGLDLMQQGVAGFSGTITQADFPPDTLSGRLQLLALGAVLTAITHSSSAGVAAVLVLLGTGSVSFGQAAGAVIGMDIGTTATAWLAAVGGSRAMRQTALAHVLYNVFTGVLAFALLGLAGPVLRNVLPGDDQTALVVFHTSFNVAGVLLILPLTRPFTRLVDRLVPERPVPMTEALDRRMIGSSDSAIDAAGTCARAITANLHANLAAVMTGQTDTLPDKSTAEIAAALVVLQSYIAQISVAEDQHRVLRRYTALLHLFDHLQRLSSRSAQVPRVLPLRQAPGLLRPALLLGHILRQAPTDPRFSVRLDRLNRLLPGRLERLRHQILAAPPKPGRSADQTFALTGGLRWLSRTTQHLMKVAHYQALAAQENPPRVEPDAFEEPDD